MGQKNKKIENVESVVVASTVLADLFGLTTRRIRQLAEEGVITKVSRGRYNLQESIKNYVVYLKTTSELKEKEDESIDYDIERALHERVKRERTELQVAAMKGTMHFSEDVERVMNDMLSNFRSKLLALPSKLAPKLIGKDEVIEIQEEIQGEVLETLQELSNYDPEMFYNEDTIELEEEYEEEEIYDQIEVGENIEENKE